MLDNNLNFKKHVQYLLNKISKKVYFLNIIGKNLSMFVKLTLYKAIIAPHLDFCTTILFNINNIEMQK